MQRDVSQIKVQEECRLYSLRRLNNADSSEISAH